MTDTKKLTDLAAAIKPSVGQNLKAWVTEQTRLTVDHEGRLRTLEGVTPPPPPPPPPGQYTWLTDLDFTKGALTIPAVWKTNTNVGGDQGIVNHPKGTGTAYRLRTLAGQGNPYQQVSIYTFNDPFGGGKACTQGQRSVLLARFFFPDDWQPTDGEWNWLLEKHLRDTVPQNQNGVASNALGVERSGGSDRFFFRVMGGNPSSPTFAPRVYFPLQRGVLEFLWVDQLSTKADGLSELWLNNSKVASVKGPNLFTDANGNYDLQGFGAYNYHPIVQRETANYLERLAIGT